MHRGWGDEGAAEEKPGKNETFGGIFSSRLAASGLLVLVDWAVLCEQT